MQQLIQDHAGSASVAEIAKAFSLDPAKTQVASNIIFEALANRMERATLSRSGLADLVEIIGAPGRNSYLEPGTLLAAPQVQSDGIGILSQLLGSKVQSRTLAARASARSGLSESEVKAILPPLAAVLMASLSKTTQAAFGDILKIPGLDEVAREARDDLGGGGQLAPPQYGSPLPLPGEPPHRTSPAKDWTSSVGKNPPAPVETPPATTRQPGKSPLPIPGDERPGMGRHGDNPYGDLADILRRGGFRIPGGIRIPGGSSPPAGGRAPSPDVPIETGGGGLLDTVIRNVLGNVLGYQPRGIVGWIIRLIVMRWGLGFVRSLLRRVLGINI
jgi:hypothetical protein